MKHIAYILISLSLLSCHGNNETIISLNTAESLMTDDPQKAKHILESIDATRLDKALLKAKYALLYSQVLDKNYYDISNDSLITIAVNYYDMHGDNREKAMAHYYHGVILSNANDLDNAIQAFVLSENAALLTDDDYLLGLINSSIGYLYDAQHSFSEALSRFHRAEDYFRKSNAIHNQATVLAQIARLHYLRNENDVAFSLNKIAIELYRSINEEDEIQRLYESTAAIQLAQNKSIDSVKRVLQASYSKTNSGEIPVLSLGLWQTIYYQERNLDSARICGLKILQNKEFFSESQIAGCLTELGKIEHLAGNYEQAYQYSLLYEEAIDSIHASERECLIQEVEQKYKNRILQQSNLNLQSRQKYQRVIIVLLTIILIVGGILINAAINRWRKRVKIKIKCAEEEIELLRSTYLELQNQYNAIKIKADSSDTKEAKVMAALQARLRGLCDLVENTQSTKSATFVKLFQQYVKVNVRSDISLSDLQYVVNKNYFGIIDYLEENYPNLTKQDLDLCSLLCFGFSQYGICYIYGAELQTFYNRRHRLREALGLKQNQKIEVFIKELISKLEVLQSK